MYFRIVKPESKEFYLMWETLGKRKINQGLEHPSICPHPETGECWQYMGTYDGKHEFRHRQHPVDGKRKIVDIAVTYDEDMLSGEEYRKQYKK